MQTDKTRTDEESKTYMEELKQWLLGERETPAEEMSGFFEKRIGIYDQVHLEHWAKEYDLIADYLDDGLAKLLDIGCGTGLELQSIYRRFPGVLVTGVDLSAEMLKELEKKYPDKELQLICADYFQHPFEENSFDAAVSFETLHHFPYEKKQTIYHKLYHALKPNGYYVECDYMARCEEEEALCMKESEYRREKYHIGKDTFVHIDIPLTPKHQIELMRQAGFSHVDVLYQNQGTVVIRADKS